MFEHMVIWYEYTVGVFAEQELRVIRKYRFFTWSLFITFLLLETQTLQGYYSLKIFSFSTYGHHCGWMMVRVFAQIEKKVKILKFIIFFRSALCSLLGQLLLWFTTFIHSLVLLLLFHRYLFAFVYTYIHADTA